ncbi:MAG: efflux RND transporter periplasmic adaptor subunit [Gammaproteobacteria bacterium]|nr:efflux RND transporter periplasmic adaptor subunit [Gammaproteobacteria bacterium]
MAAATALACTGLTACGTSNVAAVKTPAGAPTAGAVIVRSRPVTARFSAYGQVQPIAPVRVRAAEDGTVAAMLLVPGSPVAAGQILARLDGPQIEALLGRRRAAVDAARAGLAAARSGLDVERRQLALDLSTRQAVASAQSALATAEAGADSAVADLRAADRLRYLRAPTAGRVLAVNAADGEQVMAGQTVLTLQADDRLWLRAAYYGADSAAVRVGMAGVFRPASGGDAMAVRVVAVSASLAADGGETVGLMPVRRAKPDAPLPRRWIAGEYGTVSLAAGTRSLVAVPTAALVLDHAHWYVLVAGPAGVRRQEVVPGPARGWFTFIVRGLIPGQRVIAENAYLEFHRGIAARYTPPD